MMGFSRTRLGFLLLFSIVFILIATATVSYAFKKTISSRPIQKPIESGNEIVLVTEDGRLTAYDKDTGQEKRSAAIGERLTYQAVELNGKITVVAGKKVQVFELKSFEKIAEIILDSQPMAAISSGTFIAAITEKELLFLDMKGNLKWKKSIEQPMPLLIAYSNKLGYVAADELNIVDFSKNGELVFKAEVGKLFNSKPVPLSDMSLLVGNTDGIVQRVGAAGTIWKFATNGWIVTQLMPLGSSIVFGSGNGNVYSIGSDGVLEWKQEIGPISDLSVKDSIVAGHGNKITILEQYGEVNGTVVLKNDVLHVLVTDNGIIATTKSPSGTYELLTIGTSGICSMLSHETKEYVKPGDVIFSGDYVAQEDTGEVTLLIDGFEVKADAKAGKWKAYVQEQTIGEPGLKEIQCKYAGRGNVFVSEPVLVFFSDHGTDRIMRVHAPNSVSSNINVSVIVTDEEGNELRDVAVVFAGEKYLVSGNGTVPSGSMGAKTLTVSKKGYKTVSKTIAVYGIDLNYLILAAFVMLIIGILLIWKG